MPATEVRVSKDHGTASQADGFKTDPSVIIADLLSVEASQPQMRQLTSNPADHSGFAATRRAGEQEVLRS